MLAAVLPVLAELAVFAVLPVLPVLPLLPVQRVLPVLPVLPVLQMLQMLLVAQCWRGAGAVLARGWRSLGPGRLIEDVETLLGPSHREQGIRTIYSVHQ